MRPPWPACLSVRISLPSPVSVLMHRSRRGHSRVQFNLAKSTFVTGHILLQKSEKRLGLLRTEVNALEVTNLYLSFGLLLQGSEDHEKILDIHSHLHAVGISFAVVRCVV